MSAEFKPDWRVHPGEILKETLDEMHLTQKVAAASLGISESYLSDVINSRRAVSPDLAGRLGKLFGPTPGFWLKLQALHDAPKAVA